MKFDFQACIREGQLNTAASYLIVLQTMENSQTSQEVLTILKQINLFLDFAASGPSSARNVEFEFVVDRQRHRPLRQGY